MSDNSAPPTTMAGVKASVMYFAMVMGTGFVLGAIRLPLLVPRLGERVAELLEMPVMLLVVIVAARYVVRRFSIPPQPRARLLIGVSALILVVFAELGLAAAIQDLSVGQYIASRDRVSGSVYLFVLLLFALMPYILMRLHAGSAPGHAGEKS